jgi:hypothetical protein
LTESLPELLDAKRLQRELGITRAAAEAIMRRLPVVQIEGLRKTYVRRGDVAGYLEAHTFSKSPREGSSQAQMATMLGRRAHLHSHDDETSLPPA